MIISIASGKGGTGKTTLSLGLAFYLNELGKEVHLLDCDVEEPNINLFLKTEIILTESVYKPVPGVVKQRCDKCGKCEEICEFNCILVTANGPLIFPDICHSCSGCKLVCPTGAIIDEMRVIGIIEEGACENINYIGGRLNVSEAMSPPLIKSVKKHIAEGGINIIDAPPGTSCPVIESVIGSDYVVMVTEPTPFGLHDLSLGLEMIRELNIPHGVVINRADIGDDRVARYCKYEGIDILAEIPNSHELAKRYAQGDLRDYIVENLNEEFENIISRTCLSGITRYNNE